MVELYPWVGKLNIFLLRTLLSTNGHNVFPNKALKFLFALFSDLQIKHILSLVVFELHYLDLWIFKSNDIAFRKNISIRFSYLYESAELWSYIFDEKLILVFVNFCMMPRDGFADYYDIIVNLSAYLSGMLKNDDLLFKVKLK